VEAHWEEATGEPIDDKERDPQGSYAFLDGENPRFILFPPKTRPVGLAGPELQRMKALLAMEGGTEVPSTHIAKNYFRMRLSRGQLCGSVRANSTTDSRRDNLARVNLTVQRRTIAGGVQEVDATVYGSLHHSTVVYIAGVATAYANIECFKSSGDRQGSF